MRKFALSMMALVAFVGFTFATSVTVVKWDDDKSELTVKDGDKEKTYKVTKDTKVKMGDMDGDIEKVKGQWKKLGDKAVGKKLDITVDKDDKTITDIKMEAKKKKGDK